MHVRNRSLKLEFIQSGIERNSLFGFGVGWRIIKLNRANCIKNMSSSSFTLVKNRTAGIKDKFTCILLFHEKLQLRESPLRGIRRLAEQISVLNLT